MRLLYFILIGVITVCSCGSNLPQFDANNSYDILKDQCDLGPRYPGSEGIELCREYIIHLLEDANAVIEQQKFTVQVADKEYQGINILASFYPRMSRRILLGAHYDTRPWADKEQDKGLHDEPIIGANDAASGVAVLLEISRILSQHQPSQFGVDMVFFDLEDMGQYGNSSSWCLGSQYFAENFKGRIPEKAIVVDMIGDNDLSIEMEYSSYHNSPTLVNEIWDLARNLGYNEFKYQIGAKVYDDHFPLIQAGFDAIDIIDFDYEYWHTLADTPDKCSPNSLQIVGQTLTNLIYLK